LFEEVDGLFGSVGLLLVAMSLLADLTTGPNTLGARFIMNHV